jgi:cobalt-zinc-cadmium efflux system outer membrane protein
MNEVKPMALVPQQISLDWLKGVKAPGLNDRKWVRIDLILNHLRSFNRGSFHAAPTCQDLFVGVLVSFIAFLLVASGLCYAEEPLTFEEAYQHLLSHANPLKSAEAAIGAAQGSQLQASLCVNPVLNIDLQSLCSGTFGEDANELFVGITQLIELGGKRYARIQAAAAETCAVAWDLEILKAELFGQLLHAFIKTSAAQERVLITQNQRLVLEQSLESMQKKQESGKSARIALKQAELTLQTAKLKEAKAETALRNAFVELRGIWGGPFAPSHEAVSFPLHAPFLLPPLPQLQENLKNSPRVHRAEADVCIASKAIQLEKTDSYPDISLQVGVTTYRFNKDASAAVGVDIPLLFFDRNQGNICKARHQYSEALYDYAVLLTNLKTELDVLYQAWKTALEQAVHIKEQLIPIARESFELAKLGHEEGKFECFELFNARTQLFNMEEMCVDALEELHHKRADILTLTKRN